MMILTPDAGNQVPQVIIFVWQLELMLPVEKTYLVKLARPVKGQPA